MWRLSLRYSFNRCPGFATAAVPPAMRVGQWRRVAVTGAANATQLPTPHHDRHSGRRPWRPVNASTGLPTHFAGKYAAVILNPRTGLLTRLRRLQ